MCYLGNMIQRRKFGKQKKISVLLSKLISIHFYAAKDRAQEMRDRSLMHGFKKTVYARWLTNT